MVLAIGAADLLPHRDFVRISTDAIVRNSGQVDAIAPDAGQVPVELLPDDAIVFLLASRFCESDKLLDMAWQLFGTTRPGWRPGSGDMRFRAQSHCLQLSERQADPYRWRSLCRMQRCLSRVRPPRHRLLSRAQYPRPLLHRLPRRRRYTPFPPGDFAAWFEAYLGGRWYTFDPRNNVPRIGRVLIARGRDAADVAMVTTSGPNTLESFRVWTDEVPGIGSSSGLVPQEGSPRGFDIA